MDIDRFLHAWEVILSERTGLQVTLRLKGEGENAVHEDGDGQQTS